MLRADIHSGDQPGCGEKNLVSSDRWWWNTDSTKPILKDMFYLIRETAPLSTEHQVAQLIERAKSKPRNENAPAKERVNPATMSYYPVKMEVGGLLNEFRVPTGPMSYN